MSITPGKINVQFVLDGDTFDGSNNTIFLQGLMVRATIVSYTGSTTSFASQLQMRVSGMKNQDMAKLSTLGFTTGLYRRNAVAVYAGDDDVGMSLLFIGGITYGNVDYNAMPDVGLDVTAYAGIGAQYSAIAGSSYQGAMNVATMLQGIASNAGLSFQNAGVTAVLTNHAVGGSAMDQIRNICQASNTQYAVENNTLTIWPAGGSRDQTVIDISANTGLVGYPIYTVAGVDVTTRFNPQLQVGRMVNLTSSLPSAPANAPATNSGVTPGANGQFYVFGVTHEISAQLPKGPWFTTSHLGRSKFDAH